MMEWVFRLCYLLLSLGLLLGFLRLSKGPDILNRILAFDYCCACTVGLVAVYSVQAGTDAYLELVMIFSLLGFATVICFMEAFFSRIKEKNSD